jgi:hypothetical protein
VWLRTSETVTNDTTTRYFNPDESIHIIHSIPELQLVFPHTVNIPRTLPRILLQELCNFCQVFCRQLHISCTQIFQSALHVSAGNGMVSTTNRIGSKEGMVVGHILTKIQEAG